MAIAVQFNLSEIGDRAPVSAASAATPSSAGALTDLNATTDEVLRHEVEIKALGYPRTARAVAPHFIEQGWGRIINISGLGARQVNSIAHTIRNVSVSALTDELGPQGIDVTVVHPRQTRTERLTQRLTTQAAVTGTTVADLEADLEADLPANSIRRVIDAAEVADVVTFLASPAAPPSPATPQPQAAASPARSTTDANPKQVRTIRPRPTYPQSSGPRTASARPQPPNHSPIDGPKTSPTRP